MDGAAEPHAFMEGALKPHPYWMETLYQRCCNIVLKMYHCIEGLVPLYQICGNILLLMAVALTPHREVETQLLFHLIYVFGYFER